VGGAERWYRNLAERLAAEGHEVTYLTLRQWDGHEHGVPGVDVRVVGPRMELYVKGVSGRRRILPPLVFGAGVLLHLLRRGGRYDVVHTASFPYFSLLAAALARPLARFRLVVDWHEVWSRDYWREYLGAAGRLGWAVQALCARVPQRAFCFSRLHAGRLRDIGLRGEVEVLTGEYAGASREPGPAAEPPVAMFAGRHIPEKRVPAIVPAIALAREQVPGLRSVIYGDGPDRARVEALVREHGLEAVIDVPGFVSGEEVSRAMCGALCIVLPSRREGYGMVVVEAAAQGVPTVVVEAPDNAATELVDEGENGVVAASAEPRDLAEAIVRVHREGTRLRAATGTWFEHNAHRLSLRASLDRVLEAYASLGPRS
jgi:glycosyltransferase involved in cell wall biosynthesis